MEKPLIQMDERSNLIASPREFRGLRYSPELEKEYRLLLKTRQVEENSNLDHHHMFDLHKYD